MMIMIVIAYDDSDDYDVINITDDRSTATAATDS